MSENKVLATVNGKDITSQDVYQFLNQLDHELQPNLAHQKV